MQGGLGIKHSGMPQGYSAGMRMSVLQRVKSKKDLGHQPCIEGAVSVMREPALLREHGLQLRGGYQGGGTDYFRAARIQPSICRALWQAGAKALAAYGLLCGAGPFWSMGIPLGSGPDRPAGGSEHCCFRHTTGRCCCGKDR